MPVADPPGTSGTVRPVAPPCSSPVDVPADQRFVLPALLAVTEGERRVADAIHSGFLRPADGRETTRVEPTVLAWLPLWRVDVEVDGFHVGLSHVPGTEGRAGFVMPTGGKRHREAVMLVPARRLLPYDISARVQIEAHDLVTSTAPCEGERVEADVPRAEAEQLAASRLRHRVEPDRALYAKYESRIRSAALCFYPVYLGRYRYRGEATARIVEDCWVAVSARSGKVAGAHHPSAFRSVVGKVKRLFGGG